MRAVLLECPNPVGNARCLRPRPPSLLLPIRRSRPATFQFPVRFLDLGPVGHAFTASFAAYLSEGLAWLGGAGAVGAARSARRRAANPAVSAPCQPR